MRITINTGQSSYAIDTQKGVDLSTSIHESDSVNAFYLPEPTFQPFCAGGFIGSVKAGGACNCENIQFNAHGNGTHTECVGHVSKERISINQCLKEFFFIAQIISVTPGTNEAGDSLVSLESVKNKFSHAEKTEALIIRTLPNNTSKKSKKYSGTNPTYFAPAVCKFVAESAIKHLIVDTPSVDREEDGGHLLAHKAFWNYPDNIRMDATITELAYIPDSLEDGFYFLNLQIASFESDASPSKPVLYTLEKI